MTDKQRKAILAVVSAIQEAVDASPQGLPTGHLDATLMTFGCTLQQYESIIGTMVGVGQIRKVGHVLYPV